MVAAAVAAVVVVMVVVRGGELALEHTPSAPSTHSTSSAISCPVIFEGSHRGTRHLQAAEPRRRGGREREGVNRDTCHRRVLFFQLPPPPRPPRFLHQWFLHRCALFKRSKPFVGAAGPMAVVVDT